MNEADEIVGKRRLAETVGHGAHVGARRRLEPDIAGNTRRDLWKRRQIVAHLAHADEHENKAGIVAEIADRLDDPGVARDVIGLIHHDRERLLRHFGLILPCRQRLDRLMITPLKGMLRRDA